MRIPPRVWQRCLPVLALCVLAAPPAPAAWQITATATGSETETWWRDPGDWGEYTRDLTRPIDLAMASGNLCVDSGGYIPGHPTSFWTKNGTLEVRFRLEWVGPPPVLGISDGAIKVRLRVQGGASVWAKPYKMMMMGQTFIGTCRAKAQLTSSLGSTALLDVTGTDPNHEATASEPLDLSETRALEVNDGVAETTVTLGRLSYVSETNGRAEASANLLSSVTLAIVQLYDPNSAGDPVLQGANEYTFALRTYGDPPGERMNIVFPCTTRVLQYTRYENMSSVDPDRTELAAPGVLDWSSQRSWPNAMDRFGNVYVSDTASVVPISIATSGSDLITGLGFGKPDNLPANNSDLGANTITLHTADWVNVEGPPAAPRVAPCEVFWPVMDTHHPDPGHGVTPNWYHYYPQLLAPPITIEYRAQGSSYVRGEDHVHLGTRCNGSQSWHVFRISPTTGLVAGADTFHTVGIHSFGWVLYHEYGHYRLWQMGLDRLWPVEQDTDGDGMHNVDEIAHHLNPEMRDTTGVYGLGLTPGDQQCFADVLAYGGILPHAGLADQDWASDGAQKGVRTPSKYPWWYTSTNSNQPPQGVQLLTAIP